MTHPRTRILLAGSLALLLVSVGCRGSRNDETHYEPMMAPPYEEGPYDSQPYNADPFGGPSYEYGGDSDNGPLVPVPQSGPADRAPIPLPDPTATNRRNNAPPMPTARRESASLPIEGDRGLMPTSATKESSSRRFWPFGKSNERRPAPQEAHPQPRSVNTPDRRMQMMPPPAPGITGRLRGDARYVAGRESSMSTVAHNPVQIEGLEFDATAADLSNSVANLESVTPVVDAQPVGVTEVPDDTADTSSEQWRLAEGESHVDVWPFAAEEKHPLEDLAAEETTEVAGTTVPVSATDIDDTQHVEPIPFDADAPLPLITPGLRRTGPVSLAPAPAATPRRPAARRTALPIPEPTASIDEDPAPPVLAAPGASSFDE